VVAQSGLGPVLGRLAHRSRLRRLGTASASRLLHLFWAGRPLLELRGGGQLWPSLGRSTSGLSPPLLRSRLWRVPRRLGLVPRPCLAPWRGGMGGQVAQSGRELAWCEAFSRPGGPLGAWEWRWPSRWRPSEPKTKRRIWPRGGPWRRWWSRWRTPPLGDVDPGSLKRPGKSLELRIEG